MDAKPVGQREVAERGGPRGPLPVWLAPVAMLGEKLYGWEIARRNRAFDAGRGVVTLDRPVISVGNLSVGGTGKSPMVGLVVRMLLEMGRRPCIAMRGYGARPGERSDEEDAYLRAFASVPVVARPNRVEGLLDLFASEEGAIGASEAREAEGAEGAEGGTDVVVLDDGFQHRRLARDLDIVMIDATRSPFEDRLLPRGWLREPVSSLSRAGLVVVTHGGSGGVGGGVADIAARVREVNPAAAVIGGEHVWDGLLWRGPGEAADRVVQVRELAGKRVMVCCAIGNPERFVEMVRGAMGGAGEVVERMLLRDHDPFTPATIGAMLERARGARAEVIVTTDKDWSKLRHVRPEAWPCAVARPRLEMRVSDVGVVREALRGVVLGEREGGEGE